MHSRTAFDRILRQATIAGREAPADIGLRGGKIAAIETRLQADAPETRLDGRLVLPGFVDSHIHLDKACLLGRCGHDHATLSSAIQAVSELKREFTVEDVYERGARVLEKAILKGTTHMRTHVEVDPRVGLRSFEAVKQLKRDYAWAIDLSICVFPQEGLTNDPGTEELLVEALSAGADLLGGCPYTDSDPQAQITRLFDLAARFAVDLDFHLDFDLDPSWMLMDEVCTQAVRRSYQGRVAIGHATKLSALLAGRLRSGGRSPGNRRRRSDGTARDRHLSDGARRYTQRAARARAPAQAGRARRLLAPSPPTTCSIPSRRSAIARCCAWRTSMRMSRMSRRGISISA